ncbi:MAG: ATP synthase F1 subunit epsilon [Roseburia sp.]|nr:ATP synthase F1 subunit epsilon [Roseburia sp.]
MADDNRIFAVEIIAPDGIFYEGKAVMIELNTVDGGIGVYKNHIPLTTVLAPGVVTIHVNGEEKITAAVHSGFAEILPDKVTILAESAEWSGEIIK